MLYEKVVLKSYSKRLRSLSKPFPTNNSILYPLNFILLYTISCCRGIKNDYTGQERAKKIVDLKLKTYAMLCTTWYHFDNFQKVKNTHGVCMGVLHLFKILQMVPNRAKHLISNEENIKNNVDERISKGCCKYEKCLK